MQANRLAQAGLIVAFCVASATVWPGCDLFIPPEEDVEEVTPIDSVGASDSVALRISALRPPLEAWTSGKSGDVCDLLDVCPSDLPDGRGQP
ncbi:MAG: hypothetical protein ACR2GR_04160 [Rhodothermales bacterium]